MFRRNLSRLARTVVHPAKVELIPPASFAPKSVVVLSTPNHLSLVIEQSLDLHAKNVQVVVAGVDSVSGSIRDGISQLWLDEKVHIGSSELLPDEKDVKNWKSVTAGLNMDFGSHNVNLGLANTVFNTSLLVTMFYLDNATGSVKTGSELLHSGHTLSELKILLPDGALPTEKTTVSDRWTSLDLGELVVTKCVGNLVKSINNELAAKYLETNEKLMSLASKDTLVYVKLTNSKGVQQRFEVIAGGGGWGAKADMLAISPEAKLSVGDRIEFFMMSPENRYGPGEPLAISHDTAVFACTAESVSYENGSGAEQVVDAFSGGSEIGFVFDGVAYKLPGDVVTVI